MPCLNEEETLEKCINKAKHCLEKSKVKYEILIANNGSTDNSIQIAKNNGARVVCVKEKGYGSALIGGTKEAKGKYCIMGDADDSYDFSNLMPFIEKLREGFDFVIGNRFKGGIEKDAMPFLHRYIGTPVLSFIGRLLYKNKIGDYNCGIRGYNTKKILDLHLKCSGMEYVSEMIVKASLCNYKIAEVPTVLRKDGRNRKPHLNTWKDGWRHLKFLLIHSPKWTFFYSSLALSILLCMFALLKSDNSIVVLYIVPIILIGLMLLIVSETVNINVKYLPSNNKMLSNIYSKCDYFCFLGAALLFIDILFMLICNNTLIVFLIGIFGLFSFFTGLIINVIKSYLV